MHVLDHGFLDVDVDVEFSRDVTHGVTCLRDSLHDANVHLVNPDVSFDEALGLVDI